MVNNNTNKNNDTRKIITMIVMICTLMICTTGATYAYFAIGATSTNTMSGTAATASLVITNTASGSENKTPNYIAPTNTTYQSKPMVPQTSYTGTTNVLQKAFNGGGTDKCVDGNGNVICKAFTFWVRNLSTAAVDIRGSIKFTYSGGSFTNLRWKLMDSATAVTVSSGTAATAFSATAPIKASTSKVYFDTANVALAADGGTKQYWVIIWIEETGADQSSADKGTWYATIEFEAFNETGTAIKGITSTIVS